MNDVTLTANFCSDMQEMSINEGWNAACRSFTVKTKEVISSACLGAAVTLAMGIDSADTQITDGYIDTINHDGSNGIYTVTGRDKLSIAVDYFMSPSSGSQAEYTTVGADAGTEIAGLLAVAGLSVTPITLGFTFDAGYPFSLQSVWDAVQSICRIGQWRVYCDSSGSIQMSSASIAVPGSLTDISSGSIAYSKETSTSEMVNTVIVEGPGTSASATDPTTTLSWDKKAYIYRGWITSGAQAIADLNLELYKDPTEQGRVSVPGFSSIHAGDGVTVNGDDWMVFSVNRTANQSGLISTFTLRK